MFTDIRRAIRTLVRARWATALQLTTIAIGVGGLSAVFAVVGAVVLRPLPFDKPEELVTIDVTSSRDELERRAGEHRAARAFEARPGCRRSEGSRSRVRRGVSRQRRIQDR